jgi:hypothetical protein
VKRVPTALGEGELCDGDGTSPPERVDLTADDVDGTDEKERERMAAGMALSRPSDVARPVQRLPHPRNP